MNKLITPLAAVLLVLSACAPSNSDPNGGIQARKWPAWNDSPQTVAILTATDSYAYSEIRSGLFSGVTLDAFLKHPYARQRFDLIDRRRVEEILREQNFAGGGRVDSSTGVALGKLLGAKYIVFAELNALDADSKTQYTNGTSYTTFTASATAGFTMVDVETARIVARGSNTSYYPIPSNAPLGASLLDVATLGLFNFSGSQNNPRIRSVEDARRFVVVTSVATAVDDLMASSVGF